MQAQDDIGLGLMARVTPENLAEVRRGANKLSQVAAHVSLAVDKGYAAVNAGKSFISGYSASDIDAVKRYAMVINEARSASMRAGLSNNFSRLLGTIPSELKGLAHERRAFIARHTIGEKQVQMSAIAPSGKEVIRKHRAMFEHLEARDPMNTQKIREILHKSSNAALEYASESSRRSKTMRAGGSFPTGRAPDPIIEELTQRARPGRK
jgi:hypothetical protein